MAGEIQCYVFQMYCFKYVVLDINEWIIVFFSFFLHLQLDIVQQEYIYEAGLDQFEVVKAVFDVKGSWLATVEERGQKTLDLEFFLKLWAFDGTTQRYSIQI